MVSPLFFYQLVLVILVWLCVMLQWAWPSDPATACARTLEPPPLPPKPRTPPNPFADPPRQPPCDAWAHASDLRSEAPCTPPPRLIPTRGRRRQVDPSTHCCPNPDCASRGW